MTAGGGAVVAEGVMERHGLRTWYGVVDAAPAGAAGLPVVVCHGGPGLTHDYLRQVEGLAGAGHPCVFYDQFGNGRSGHRPEAPAEFWTVDLFVRELEELIEHLGLSDGYHLLGHSWGGMLALELAVRRPRGLRSVVAASAFASGSLYTSEVGRLVGELPDEVREQIERHEAAGTTDAPEYDEAVRFFYRRHVCRAAPVPDEVYRTLVALGKDPSVYQAMAGPNEFRLTGNLRDWDITDRLHQVDVPVLLLSGRHDEVTPRAVEQLHKALPGSRWELFEESSHMAHVEENERFLALVGEFLGDGGPGR